MQSAQNILTQILRGGTLSDKLAGRELPASQWIFDPSLKPIDVPEAPGRMGALVPRIGEETASRFPKKSELMGPDSARHRGRLLHFFANHELLAIETMAFTLLRFPEAPLEFKQGVLRILKEEQDHFGSYLERMKQYGVELGEVPLNFYFWNSLKSLQSPFDFVTRMSLTFEQANLDFALEYAQFFEKELDDPETRDLLRTVHDDEVRHVAHGYYWFNRWRNPKQTEWEAYQQSLPFPMSARRARGGTSFAAKSREAAGMSPEYIESVRITGGSRGRVPELYYFNPQAELEAGGISLSDSVKKKLLDFEWVLFWLAQEEDVVVSAAGGSEGPPRSWLSQVYDWRGEIPEWVQSVGEISRPIQKIKPWAWSRSAFEVQRQLSSQLKNKCEWNAAQVEEQWLSKTWWAQQLQLGLVPTSPEQAREQLLEGVKSRPEVQKWIVKNAHSTSGRGHRVVDRSELLDENGHLALAWNSVVIEPYYSKLADFSVQYELSPDGRVKRFEPRIFETDAHFQYVSSILGVPTEPKQKGFFDEIMRQGPSWKAAHDRVLNILQSQNYVGPIGIDGLLAREPDGSLKVVSVIEVNVRYTMGRVAHEIEKALRRRGVQSAQMRLWTSLDGPSGAQQLWERLQTEHPGRVIPVTPLERVKSSWISVIIES